MQSKLFQSAAYTIPPARYIGLLGPEHRKHKVLNCVGINDSTVLHGPMGIYIGGDLPESVALATLAQCHQVLETASPSSANNLGSENPAPTRQGDVV